MSTPKLVLARETIRTLRIKTDVRTGMPSDTFPPPTNTCKCPEPINPRPMTM